MGCGCELCKFEEAASNLLSGLKGKLEDGTESQRAVAFMDILVPFLIAYMVANNDGAGERLAHRAVIGLCKGIEELVGEEEMTSIIKSAESIAQVYAEGARKGAVEEALGGLLERLAGAKREKAEDSVPEPESDTRH